MTETIVNTLLVTQAEFLGWMLIHVVLVLMAILYVLVQIREQLKVKNNA